MELHEAQALFSQYSLHKALVAGAQGDVFLGADQTGQPIVVKVIAGNWVPRADREVDALGLVEHPAVVRLIDSGKVKHGGREIPFVATAHVDGVDLGRRISAGTFQPARAPDLLTSLASGLDALWARRVVHRDIKPANIMVLSDYRGVLLDLGIALCVDMTTLTAPGMVPGTPGYLSPEQARGERNLTVKSDIYSLGVTAFEAVVGSHPFGGNQILMIQADRPPAISSPLPCSPDAARLISAMIEPQPAMRPMPSDVIAALATEVT